ncbi:MAG: NAD(P)H-hydrate dehydratase [Rhodobacteraceae bacterium]|nr:NAD(P)H-hydrate dehydratase [Paracoccaceae bacterium]
MSELLTAAQMRTVEQAAIAAGDVSGLTLMERAGSGVVKAVFGEWPELAMSSYRAVVLCGPGNNGGDGFVVARLLKRSGWEVEVFLYGDAGRLPPDARVNYQRWVKLGGVSTLSDGAIEGYAKDHPDTRLAVDAVFGTGLTRPFADLPRTQLELNYWQAGSKQSGLPHVVAIDIPSGICADSGVYLGAEDKKPFDIGGMANLTVSFHRKKIGHLLHNGPAACGKTVMCDIGLGSPQMPLNETVTLNETPLDYFDKFSGNHKFAHGHALILSGGPGSTGAARLAARGALRIGAGLVTLGVPPSAQMEVASQITAIMLKRVPDGEALAEIIEDERMNAFCLGPGLGIHRAAELLTPALKTGRAAVLDADALTAISENPELFDLLHENCVLTPHGGEFARLFPDIAAKLSEPAINGPAYSKVDATREAAARAGCVVLFKGPDTVIAAADGQCCINSAHYDRAAPWLATAGSGDVLAGFITGLMARGLTANHAAETAAWLHVQCARSFGPGLIAEDIPEELPKVFRELGL